MRLKQDSTSRRAYRLWQKLERQKGQVKIPIKREQSFWCPQLIRKVS